MINRLLNIDSLNERNLEIFKGNRQLQSIIEFIRKFNLDPETISDKEDIVMQELKEIMVGWCFNKIAGLSTSKFLAILHGSQLPDAFTGNYVLDVTSPENKEIYHRLQELKETYDTLSATNINILFESWYENKDANPIT